MAKDTIAVMGATGHIGRVLTEELLKKGFQVHAIARDQKKLEACKTKGAKVFACNFDDAQALTKAFQGCKAVFSFIPPAYTENNLGAYQDKVGEAIHKALMHTKVPYVVNLSSVGAQLTDGTGPIKGLHRHEKRLNSLPDLHVLHFRPGYFMENIIFMIPLIKNFGLMASTLKPDVLLPMIATKDIAMKACEFFENLNFVGQSVFEFIGPKELTFADAVPVIGKAVGKNDLRYMHASQSDAQAGLLASGIKPDAIRQLLEMYQAINEGRITLTQKLTAENRSKTTFEEFVKNTFVPLYQSSGVEHLSTARH